MRMPGLFLVSLATLYSQQAVSQSPENELVGSWEQCQVVEEVEGIPGHSFSIKLHFAPDGILTIEPRAFRDKLCQQRFMSEKEIMDWAPWLPWDSITAMMNPEVEHLTYRVGQKIADTIFELDIRDKSGHFFYTALKLEGDRLWEADSCEEDEEDHAVSCKTGKTIEDRATEFNGSEFYTKQLLRASPVTD
ncbi:MAG: hypothetical protein M3Q07_03675 [Pseudobdellovibrionaceae bacterium]|nr:hypothetical protein [Pseudobdellovibrionaceae bacterium]